MINVLSFRPKNSIVGKHHDEQAKLSKIERNERRASQMIEQKLKSKSKFEEKKPLKLFKNL